MKRVEKPLRSLTGFAEVDATGGNRPYRKSTECPSEEVAEAVVYRLLQILLAARMPAPQP
jgi:hypothetical protein